MTEPIYAIGDIHGQAGMLDVALDRIERDGGSDATVVFLGDYTDRGPDSKGVLDRLIAGRDAGRNWVFLKGNHDRMFEWYMETPSKVDPYMMINLYWLHERLGGDTTFESYGIDMSQKWRHFQLHELALETIPSSHVEFLKSLELTFESDHFFFCHAGIRPQVPLDRQDEEDLLWIRNEFHNFHLPHPKIVVHGHTPVDQAEHYGNRVNLDTGAGYGKPLTAAVFEGARCWVLNSEGRMPLNPAG